MGAAKTKKTVKPKKKVLTKKEKLAKRASRMQRIIEYRKKMRRARKAKIVPIKKKREQEADEEIIDYGSKQSTDLATQSEINILNILGLGDENEKNEDWEVKLEEKLK